MFPETFGQNRKMTLLGILGVFFFVLGFWLTQAPETEAADYNYLHTKLDTEGTAGSGYRDGTCGTLENCVQLWQFHGFYSSSHDGLESATTPSGYQCPIWLVEETYGMDDGGAVLWTKKGNWLKKGGTSINSDLTDKQFTSCSNTTVSSGYYCNTTDAGGVRDFTYGLVDNRGDTEDIGLSDAVATTYRPDVDILCAGSNLWKTCEANSCASVVTANDWACNGTTKVWSPCTLPQTCNDSTGACEAPAANALNLNISTSDTYNTVIVGGTLTVTFTVKKTSDSSAVNGASVAVTSLTCTSGTGSLPSPSGSTNSSGQITSTFTAPSTGGVCTINAKATKTGFTEGVSTASISVTNCASPRYAQYNTYRYVKGKSVKLYGLNPNADNDFSLCIYNQTGVLKKPDNFNSTFPKFTTFTSDSLGTWKGLSLPGRDQCPSPFNGSLGCVASTDVVECESNSDCASNNCNLSTYTCSTAPPSSPPTGPVSSPLCQAALVVSDVGKLCGTHNVTAGEVAVNGWCCSAFNSGAGFVAANQTDCQNSDPACAAAPPPVCNNNNTCDAGETNANCPADCPIVVPPSAGPCASGRDNYRSPLSYCSIQDLIQGATGWVLGLVSSIVILFLVYGGIMYTMAAGDETKMESAKNIIYYAILGLAIILISYTLITEVKTILKVK